MAYNPFDPNSRYRLPSYNLDNPLSTTGLGGALSSQQPTTDWMSNPQPRPYGGTSGGTNPFAFGTPEAADWTRQNVGDVNFSRTPPRTTTDTSILNTAPEAGLPTATTAGSRDTRYASQTGATDSLGRATTLQGVMSSAPTPGTSPTSPVPGTQTTSTGPTPTTIPASNRFSPGVSDTMRDLPAQGPLAPEFQSNYRPDDPYSALDYGLGLPKTSTSVEDVMLDPGFKWQQEQLGRKLEDIFAAKGRVGSTDYFNALTNANQKLISDEYNRINNQQWERGMEMNRLLYDRRAQENITNYEREFRENERKYGRQQAEEILAYERGFREDARDYERLRYLIQLGFGATQASTGT